MPSFVYRPFNGKKVGIIMCKIPPLRLRNNAKIAKTTFTPYGTIPKSVLAADENPIFHALWRRRIFFSPVKKSKVALWRNFYFTESQFKNYQKI